MTGGVGILSQLSEKGIIMFEAREISRILNREAREVSRALNCTKRAGHFKNYQVNGLFGKHHGVYWWDDVTKRRTGLGGRNNA